MLIVEYNPNAVDAVILADSKVTEYVDCFIRGLNKESLNDRDPDRADYEKIVVGNELIVVCFQLAIHDGKLDADKVWFLFKGGYRLMVDGQGHFESTPEGFCDYTVTYIDKILR